MEVIDTYEARDYARGTTRENVVPEMVMKVIERAFEHSDKSVTISVEAYGTVSVKIVPMKEPRYKDFIFGPDYIEFVEKEKENG